MFPNVRTSLDIMGAVRDSAVHGISSLSETCHSSRETLSTHTHTDEFTRENKHACPSSCHYILHLIPLCPMLFFFHISNQKHPCCAVYSPSTAAGELSLLVKVFFNSSALDSCVYLCWLIHYISFIWPVQLIDSRLWKLLNYSHSN